jgi:FkbM family methyltransferase
VKDEQMFQINRMGIDFWVTKRTQKTLNNEIDLQAYRCLDYVGKDVLDIGGFCGDSATLFAHWGAKTVTVVEGVEENLRLIRANMAHHHIDGRVIHAMVGPANSERTVYYQKLTGSFGIERKPTMKHSRMMKIRSLSSVLDEVGKYDVVKCDCEGGEMGFTTCTTEQIRRAEAYVMETHSKKIADTMVATFKQAGFKAERLPNNQLRPLFKFLREGGA